MPLLTLENIQKKYHSNIVIKNLNLEILQGEFLTILGPSGCGKTTLLRMIGGFETPTQGKIILRGEDITALPPYQRNINTVFQNYALFPHLDVFANIAFGLKQKKQSALAIEKKVKAMLEIVRMGNFIHHKPFQLSGGQQQRIAIARAIANEPQILLLDEPLGALDLKLRKEMQVELKQLNKQLNITFVFVTHDQEEALSMSDRIIIMNKGEIEQIGTQQEIYYHPKTDFVANFIGEINKIPIHIQDNTFTFYKQQWKIKNRSTTPFLYIRPEKCFLTNKDKGLFNARIMQSLFLGAYWNMVLITEDQNILHVYAPHNTHNIGEEVSINFKQEDTLML